MLDMNCICTVHEWGSHFALVHSLEVYVNFTNLPSLAGPNKIVTKGYKKWEDLAEDFINEAFKENVLFRLR